MARHVSRDADHWGVGERPQLSGNARSTASRRSASERCKYRLVVAMLEWPILLDDVNVLAPAHEARGIAVRPPVSKVPSGHSRRGPGLYHQIVQRPRPVTTAEAPVAPWVGEQVRGLGETRPQLFQVLAEHVRQQVGNGDHPRLASLADERDPPRSISSVRADVQD